MKLILVTFVFLLFSNSLTSQDITKIRFIYGQEGTLIPIAASCDISFIARFGEDLNILTTYDGIFIAQFQDLYSRLSHSDSTFLIDPRIMTVVSYEESIPNDTLYMGEYFGIIKNGNRMQDNDSLLNLVKTKIGWTQYTRNVIEASSIIKFLSYSDDDIVKILMSNIDKTFFVTLNKLPVTETNSFVKQKRLLKDYVNELSDVQKAKFYEVFFRVFYKHAKPDSILWNNVFE